MSELNIDPTILHAAIDGELPTHEHAAALAAISADPAASVQYAEYRRLKDSLGSLPPVDVPAGVWKGCTRRLDELDRNRKAERFVTRYAWGLCASVFLLIMGAGSWNRLTGQHLGASDVTHVAGVINPLGPAVGSNSGDVGKWLQPEKPLRSSHVRAVGIRPPQAMGTPTMCYLLADNHGFMTLYKWPGTDPIDGDGYSHVEGTQFSAGRVLDQPSVAWVKDGFHHVLTGPREVEELERVANEMIQTSAIQDLR
ncbi:MAG TPA: hypothetical protein VKT78_13490 [Fimbriimonadaceae bacterium]|nr:hypothetical protein [Fimbriimonadaceae bacterium]